MSSQDAVDALFSGANPSASSGGGGSNPAAPRVTQAPEAAELVATPIETRGLPLEAVAGLRIPCAVELGSTHLTIGELLDINPGTVLQLDQTSGDSSILQVNGQPFAEGEAVLVGEHLGLRIKRLLQPISGASR